MLYGTEKSISDCGFCGRCLAGSGSGSLVVFESVSLSAPPKHSPSDGDSGAALVDSTDMGTAVLSSKLNNDDDDDDDKTVRLQLRADISCEKHLPFSVFFVSSSYSFINVFSTTMSCDSSATLCTFCDSVT